MIKQVAFDMDGVLFDFVDHLQDYCSVERFEQKTWELNPEQYNNKINKAFSDVLFWADMPLIEDGKKLWDIIKLPKIIISHAPNVYALIGKYLAVNTYFKDEYERGNVIFLGKDKWKLGDLNTLLIDDYDKNIEKWRGPFIRFPQPWNKNKNIIENRFYFILNQLQMFGVI